MFFRQNITGAHGSRHTNASSPNTTLLASAHIEKRSIVFGAQISMRHTSAPLQMWSTNVFLAKRTLVHMGHGAPVLLKQ